MTYKALVCKIYTEPVTGLDNLMLGRCNGYQVLVGKDTPQGSLGLYFDQGGQLSEEFAKANDLVRRKIPYIDLDGNPAERYTGGMFEENRRVKAIKLKGVKSEGFWCSLDSLNYLGPYSYYNLKEGDEIDELVGHPICNKYFTKSTREHIQKQGQPKEKLVRCPMFKEHVDTEQFLRNLNMIIPGSTVTITEKMHGTSHRYGNVLLSTTITRSGFKGLLVKVLGEERALRWFHIQTQTTEWVHLNGTRRTIQFGNKSDDYYKDDFRSNATKHLEGKLHQNEVLYGELVGYTENGKPIMDTQDTSKLKDKEVTKRFDKQITYSYGCEPGECKFFIYRITQDGKDLLPAQICARCEELELEDVYQWAFDYKIVAELKDCDGINTLDIEELKAKVEDGVNGGSGSEAKQSHYDSRHIIEGYVVRVDYPEGTGYQPIFLKHKSYTFGCLEGYLKERDTYVDREEAS